ncbi:hypothetical protein [Pyxidicoccus parkwayensis]|uniref:hypothetical protein n=1 Tax=Pyxidicoccus parkwayensis TaxID=2813578 RepID=UPI001F504585|nr:hypothetical protein [Pyxidicoccus parkwaysis]
MRHMLKFFFVSACVGAGLAACGLEDEATSDEAWELEQEVDVCKGENEIPDAGKFVSDNDWNDVGAQDNSGYTGIDKSKPGDLGLIKEEQKAAAAMNGQGCVYGAHGGDPAKCGGKTSVQALPHDTSQSVFHPEYHTECVGKPLFLSVCFGGKSGTPPYISIGSAVSHNYGVPADKVVACTGTVSPGNPMKCYGSLVDGNGNPIGNQTVGGLSFVQVRGDPPAGELTRCGKDDPCPTCKPDGGTDAGTDGGCTGTSCSPDGGPRPDGGGTSDAGTPGDGGTDAGSPFDAGTPRDAGVDAGRPADAG